MPAMSKVQLRIPPWIASMLNEPDSEWLTIEKELEEGTTIGNLLVGLALSYTDFRKVVFNPDIGRVSDQVMVFLNDSLLQGSDVTEARLNDGDSIMLLPVYAGG